MSKERRKCKNEANMFCYICGDSMMKEQRRNITKFLRMVYKAYFGMKVGDQDKVWGSHILAAQFVLKASEIDRFTKRIMGNYD